MGRDNEREKSGKLKMKYEDVTSHTAPKGLKGKLSHFNKYKLKPFFMKNHKRNLKTVLALLICVVLVGGSAILLVQSKLGLINYDTGKSGDPNATFATDEDISYANMHDVSDADSLNNLIKEWATNGGEKLHSGNVINVLLLGCDDEGGSSRSDSMILVSVNRKTKQITLSSFLRDSYTYMNIANAPSGRQDRCDKVNHSYAWGGALTLIETIENDYKIEIDHFVSIDFKSFVGAINALGGVNVPITEAEARYMNRTTHFNDFVSGSSVNLDGEHALIYSRIRHNDSEVERTRRQRCVISDIINKAKGASVGELNNLINNFLPFVTTNYKKSELLSLGTQAISENWMGFEIKTTVQPSEEYRKEATMNTWSSNNLFVWIIDYPLAARELQQTLYGTTNIVIGANHISAFDFLSESNASVYDRPSTTEEDEDDESEDGGDGDGSGGLWGGIFSRPSRTTTTASHEEEPSSEEPLATLPPVEDVTETVETPDDNSSGTLE